MSQNVRCTANKPLDLEASKNLAHICTSIRYFHQSTFIQMVNVFDLHFQGQRFESSTFERSYVIISETVTDWTQIAIANKEKVEYGLSIGIFIFMLAHSNCQDQGHAHFDFYYLPNGDRYGRHCYCQQI